MILIDTDILSAMAKIARFSLLFPLFQTTRLHIIPGVRGELMHSFNLKRQYAAKDKYSIGLKSGEYEVSYTLIKRLVWASKSG